MREALALGRLEKGVKEESCSGQSHLVGIGSGVGSVVEERKDLFV